MRERFSWAVAKPASQAWAGRPDLAAWERQSREGAVEGGSSNEKKEALMLPV